MCLLSLPAELFLQILQDLGASFFREDLDRLRVCKQWYAFALPICFADITLSATALRRLISLRDAQVGMTALKENVQSVSLDLHRVRGWKLGDKSVNFPSVSDEETMKLQEDLVALSEMQREMRKLTTLRIRASCELKKYLYFSTIRSLITTSTLTVLNLDLFGTEIMSDNGGHHLCPIIGALLGTLTSLRLRLRTICPEALVPPNSDTKLGLSHVVINCGLYEKFHGPRFFRSKPCFSLGLLPPDHDLGLDIERQAKTLASCMAEPKVLRVLVFATWGCEVQTLDVLTNKRMKLNRDMAWDADGETVIEESEDETDLTETSSPGSSADDGL